MTPLKAVLIHQTIRRPWREVYDFAADPHNLPAWASGLGSEIRESDSGWIVRSPGGEFKLSFVEKNAFGVLDHEVTLPSGEVFYNPMRVVRNNDCSEVIFVLYRRPDMSDENFIEDRDMVAQDLQRLKTVLET